MKVTVKMSTPIRKSDCRLRRLCHHQKVKLVVVTKRTDTLLSTEVLEHLSLLLQLI